MAENPNHTRTKYHYEHDEEGKRQRVPVAKPIKQWWYVDVRGNHVLVVRYGSRVLELVQGKSGVIVGSEENLVPVINTIIEAVAAGELDAVIEAAQGVGMVAKKKAA